MKLMNNKKHYTAPFTYVSTMEMEGLLEILSPCHAEQRQRLVVAMPSKTSSTTLLKRKKRQAPTPVCGRIIIKIIEI